MLSCVIALVIHGISKLDSEFWLEEGESPEDAYKQSEVWKSEAEKD